MGGLLSICTDPAGEANKPGAFTTDASNSTNHDVLVEGGPESTINKIKAPSLEDSTHIIKQHEEEQARLQQQLLVVSAASRDMVSVRSMRGATYYHDQGFAAALSSHLQQTLPEPSSTPQLPPPPVRQEVVALLSRPIPTLNADDGGRRWESMVRDRKEEVFAKCPQIVESLL